MKTCLNVLFANLEIGADLVVVDGLDFIGLDFNLNHLKVSKQVTIQGCILNLNEINKNYQ